MFLVFTVMSLVLAAVLGAFQRSLRQGIMFAIIFIGISWGVGLGTLLTDNDLVWFLVVAPITIALLFLIVRSFDPGFFAGLNKEFRKEKE
jgi:hypothetical protein